jgi:hypothetical protein
VRGRSCCIRISNAYRRPSAPLLASSRPNFALQCSADHAPGDLRPCLPGHRFHHLFLLQRGGHRRSRGTQLCTIRYRSNAPKIASA